MQRSTHPSRVIALRRAVALTEPNTFAHGVLSSIGGERWPEMQSTSLDRVSRHLATKGASLVAVAGDSAAWLLRSVSVCRGTGRFPIAVMALPDETVTSELVRAGATVVIDVSQSFDDITAQLVALFESSVPTHSGLDVRWLESDGLRLDVGSRRCELNGERVSLSLNEFDLLHFLMTNSQAVIPSARITEELWNVPMGAGLNMLRLNVARLRKKLGDSAREARYIESVRGLGYRFKLPVAEVGQERSEVKFRHAVATLNAQHDGLYDIIDRLCAASSTDDLAQLVVEWATGRGFADAATVFRVEQHDGHQYSHLVASAGMSMRWRQSIAYGHRVDDGFIASAAYVQGSVIQLSDMSRPGSRFPATVSMSSAEDLHACVIFPLVRDDVIWGDVGFLSHERRAFPPSRVRYLRAVADLVSLTLSRPPLGEED